jgi:type IV pilus assembly protein PilA
MIVVVIIGILAALAIPKFLKITGKAKCAEAKTTLKEIFTLEKAYYNEHEFYVPFSSGSECDEIGFGIPEGNTRFNYQVTCTDSSADFEARATEAVDVDGDGATSGYLTMDHNGDTGQGGGLTW